ncbi:MAG: CDP-alcohol phosphatidyltransferase family protein [Candidatus Marinimicrobia bacterium]|jgi:CDP-diacylglycerol--glycerol-3-phosphate 3-phosphatidyltransferase|nr:CDP-alcohol phosphatidyltransferase family protein [Candidatus Neomarinimicrobiota bacterium]MBT3633023.1 CDP-alcohol phosphatidyltransferase family protein [Candidatus Neomarinimicrobiota bacterium]MBT3683535.1 CDP-alcohol phosphatidyltransferase family protein [Candidatus Neomarinimicrobiota bacterium]MBT3896468.1 CDP-alcohol phosphatidyltransferase family protein [Candidatus Neomarinimicrobiota bacterium]MBT4173160.1 CDP-alcohol phosphatidyltransferase family protein [Candidatus Neomarini
MTMKVFSLKNIPNFLSTTRILASPVLMYLIWSGNESVFTWLLIASLVSDFLDGYIARRFKLESALGARLDSTGDMATYICAIVGIIRFQSDVILPNINLLIIVIVFYALEAIYSLIKYKKISSFHTVLTKVTAYSQGIFIITLFVFGFYVPFFYYVVGISIIAYIEEMLIITILPENQSNVGGLFRVLKNRKTIK